MKVFDVVIQGTRPILFNNPAGLGKSASVKSSGDKRYPTADEAARNSCYWLDDGSSIAFPSVNIQACMIRAASGWKVLKGSATPWVAGSVEIDPEMVSFNTKEFLIDTRRVVVQRQGILRSRAKLAVGWELNFKMLVGDDIPMPDESVAKLMKQCLEEGGRRIGIGDFRPERKGKFGKFVVTKFVENKQRK
jgi:hypothetical protein